MFNGKKAPAAEPKATNQYKYIYIYIFFNDFYSLLTIVSRKQPRAANLKGNNKNTKCSCS